MVRGIAGEPAAKWSKIPPLYICSKVFLPCKQRSIITARRRYLVRRREFRLGRTVYRVKTAAQGLITPFYGFGRNLFQRVLSASQALPASWSPNAAGSPAPMPHPAYLRQDLSKPGIPLLLVRKIGPCKGFLRGHDCSRASPMSVMAWQVHIGPAVPGPP